MAGTLFQITPSLELVAADGSLGLHRVRAQVEESLSGVASLLLIAEVSASDAARALEREWLHLRPEVCSTRSGGPWREDTPVRIEARLADDLLTAATVFADDVWDVLAEVRFARHVSALHRVTSWYALRLTQPHPRLVGVRQGLSTTWADAGRL